MTLTVSGGMRLAPARIVCSTFAVKRTALVALAALVVIVWCRGGDDSSAALRVATFNIENFPKSERQVRGGGWEGNARVAPPGRR